MLDSYAWNTFYFLYVFHYFNFRLHAARSWLVLWLTLWCRMSIFRFALCSLRRRLQLVLHSADTFNYTHVIGRYGFVVPRWRIPPFVWCRDHRSASSSSLVVRLARLSTIGDRAFPIVTSRLWNTPPQHVTSVPSLTVFTKYRSASPFWSLCRPNQCPLYFLIRDFLSVYNGLRLCNIPNTSAVVDTFPKET